MKSDKLYRVQREDLPKLEQLLYRCFAHDPLYETLIPDAEIRKRLMPELFQCDMDEFYETCEIFADSQGWGLPELKLDRSAAPDTVTSYYLSCSRSGNAAPWDRCETVR